ncbi:MAG: tripartite tricarboxylate transporter substrate binding protein [Actinomycetota bacterium]|nr:tripartite tricarboxylate transporter substrate binding protein [Actinomycetota bacterium]
MSAPRTTVLALACAAALTLSACGDSSGTDTGSASGDPAGSGEAWTPEGDVTMVVPFSAGGGSDLSGRAMATGLEGVADDLTMRVENRDGGSGAVGYSYFLTKEGDPNYVLATETALLALPLTQDVEFDHTSFTPIMKVGEDYTLLVVAADSPHQSCTDVIDAAGSGQVVAGISGETGLDNVVFTLTEEAMGVSFDRVPFESGGELIAAVLGGQVDIASLNPGEVIGQLESGDIRALCAYADERYEYEDLADIPTAKEEGIDVVFAQYRGLLAPGGITEEETQGWIELAEAYAESSDYTEYIESNYLQPVTAFGDDFATYLEENSATLAEALQ